jgi:hypothetical protein
LVPKQVSLVKFPLNNGCLESGLLNCGCIYLDRVSFRELHFVMHNKWRQDKRTGFESRQSGRFLGKTEQCCWLIMSCVIHV